MATDTSASLGAGAVASRSSRSPDPGTSSQAAAVRPCPVARPPHGAQRRRRLAARRPPHARGAPRARATAQPCNWSQPACVRSSAPLRLLALHAAPRPPSYALTAAAAGRGCVPDRCGPAQPLRRSTSARRAPRGCTATIGCSRSPALLCPRFARHTPPLARRRVLAIPISLLPHRVKVLYLKKKQKSFFSF
jgi:hypothetical protein